MTIDEPPSGRVPKMFAAFRLCMGMIINKGKNIFNDIDQSVRIKQLQNWTQYFLYSLQIAKQSDGLDICGS